MHGKKWIDRIAREVFWEDKGMIDDRVVECVAREQKKEYIRDNTY